ncbi:MAG: hypothetical protein OEM02_10965, partial [Desulfobulbaceae bacterium]|nr:hypothetical protein [Desulfobulbaceae bacterium]
MFDAQSFFDLTRFPHSAVFANTKYCWQALANLKQFLSTITSDSPLYGCRYLGMPLPETLVLYDGELLSGTTCEIEYGDTLKGGLQVRREGVV